MAHRGLRNPAPGTAFFHDGGQHRGFFAQRTTLTLAPKRSIVAVQPLFKGAHRVVSAVGQLARKLKGAGLGGQIPDPIDRSDLINYASQPVRGCPSNHGRIGPPKTAACGQLANAVS